MLKARRKRKPPKRVLALPDLEWTMSAVINSVTALEGDSEHTITRLPNSSIRLILNRDSLSIGRSRWGPP